MERRLKCVLIYQLLNACDNRKRRQMQRDAGSDDPINEKFLFHGTSRNAVDAICANSFDWRLCGSHGTVYGQGNLTAASFAGHCMMG